MLNTFLQTLPLALGGAVNPLGIVILFYYLSKKDQPLKRCLAIFGWRYCVFDNRHLH